MIKKAIRCLVLVLIFLPGVIFSPRMTTAAEEMELRVQAIDSRSGKPVPHARIAIRSLQLSGEWPETNWDESGADGWATFPVFGEGFLIQAEKSGYEWFTFGGCSGYLLAKVVAPGQFRTLKHVSRILLQDEREVLIEQTVKYLETQIYLAPEEPVKREKLSEQLVSGKQIK